LVKDMMENSEGDKNKINYTKEDLVWESVRRNENYKKYYSRWQEHYSDKISSRYHGLDAYPIDNYWKLSKLYNPEINIDEIKKQIENGEKPSDVHPYYNLFNRSETMPVIFHGVPGSKYHKDNNRSRYDFFDSSVDRKIICINKSVIVNRVVISIDPLTSNTELFDEIKKIKTNALEAQEDYSSDKNKRLEIANEESKKEGESSPSWRNRHVDFKCYTRDIHSYFGWLKIYDEVTNYCRIQKMKYPTSLEFNLIEDDGVFTVTSAYSFQHMVPDEIEQGTKEHDYARRTLTSQYESAVKLIKSAPNIIFSSSKKTQKSSE
jgi:hypothetical protein